MFNDMSPAQWMWYYYNSAEDENEKFELNRDLVEYHASFIEPEAVKKIREAREQKIELSNDQFNAGLERVFGRGINPSSQGSSDEVQTVDVASAISNYKNLVRSQKNAIDRKGLDYKHWLNSNLE